METFVFWGDFRDIYSHFMKQGHIHNYYFVHGMCKNGVHFKVLGKIE